MTQVSALREMMQPLWNMMEKEGMPKETRDILTFFMDEATEGMKEEERLAEKQVQLNIETARMEGRRAATMRFMEVFLSNPVFKRGNLQLPRQIEKLVIQLFQ